MNLLISEILEKVSKVKTKKDKVNILRENDHQSLRMVIKSSFDPKIEFKLSLAWKKNHYLSKASKVFMTYLSSTVKSSD